MIITNLFLDLRGRVSVGSFTRDEKGRTSHIVDNNKNDVELGRERVVVAEETGPLCRTCEYREAACAKV